MPFVLSVRISSGRFSLETSQAANDMKILTEDGDKSRAHRLDIFIIASRKKAKT